MARTLKVLGLGVSRCRLGQYPAWARSEFEKSVFMIGLVHPVLVSNPAQSSHMTWTISHTRTGSELLFSGIAGILVCYIDPFAAGSGIPEIKCYLNGIEHFPSALRQDFGRWSAGSN